MCTFSIQCLAATTQTDVLDKLAQGIIVNSIWRIQANDYFQKASQNEAEKSIKTALNTDELNDIQQQAVQQIKEVFQTIPEEILLNPMYITQAKQILSESLSPQEIQELDNAQQLPNPETYVKLANAESKILELGSTLTQNALTDPLSTKKIRDKTHAIIQQLDNVNENK